MDNIEILNNLDCKYIIKDDYLYIEIIDKRYPTKGFYKVKIKSKNKYITELRETNFTVLYLLSYIYRDIIRISGEDKRNEREEEIFELSKVLRYLYGKDWVLKSSLLKDELNDYKSLKVVPSVEGYSFENNIIQFKIIIKFKGKQFTYYREGEILETSQQSFNKVYKDILNELRDVIVGNKSENELFKKYENLMIMKLGKYIEYGLLDIKRR